MRFDTHSRFDCDVSLNMNVGEELLSRENVFCLSAVSEAAGRHSCFVMFLHEVFLWRQVDFV